MENEYEVTQNEVSEDVVSAVDTSSNEHITTSLTTYRTYGVYNEKGAAVGAKGANPAVLSETQTHKNWDAAEAQGATVLNQNQYKFYTLADESALAVLVPDATQRLYIIQKGLDAIQTAAANKLQTELQDKKDKEDPDVFMYNEEVIDLRDSINTPPQKKNLTPLEKFNRALGVVNSDELAGLIEQLKRQLAEKAAV